MIGRIRVSSLFFYGLTSLMSGSRFTRSFLQSPLSGDEVWFTSAVNQADLDGDGHVDLIIGNYNPDDGRALDPDATGTFEPMMHSLSRAFNGGRSRLLLGSGDRGSEAEAPQPSVPPPSEPERPRKPTEADSSVIDGLIQRADQEELIRWSQSQGGEVLEEVAPVDELDGYRGSHLGGQ